MTLPDPDPVTYIQGALCDWARHLPPELLGQLLPTFEEGARTWSGTLPGQVFTALTAVVTEPRFTETPSATRRRTGLTYAEILQARRALVQELRWYQSHPLEAHQRRIAAGLQQLQSYLPEAEGLYLTEPEADNTQRFVIRPLKKSKIRPSWGDRFTQS